MSAYTDKMPDKAELADIRNVVIDTTKPVNERIKDYNRQIKNKGCILYEDTVVRISFLDEGPSLRDRIKQYLLSGQGAGLTSI